MVGHYGGISLQFLLLVDGPKGQVLKYVRPRDRCPAGDFLGGCEKKFRLRFEGSFGTLANQLGASYEIHERFKPLHGVGKPLWEFKEHYYRLYCLRIVGVELVKKAGRVVGRDFVSVILLNGWRKEKQGKGTNEEKTEIKKALTLLKEYEESLTKERRSK